VVEENVQAVEAGKKGDAAELVDGRKLNVQTKAAPLS
jgi:hypothetical protein